MKLYPTSNPAFSVDIDNNYYRYDSQSFVLEPSVINIDNEGNYTVKTSTGKNTQDYLLATYDVNHNPISFKIIDNKNNVYTSSKYVAKCLNMKPEVVKKNIKYMVIAEILAE